MLIKVVLGHEIRIEPPRLLPFIKILPHTEQFSKENNFVDEISRKKKYSMRNVIMSNLQYNNSF